MRGLLTKTFRPSAEDTESGSPPTIPEVAGMIWEEELAKDRRKREWRAFYAGCIVGTVVLSLSIIFLVKLTGGACS